MSEQTKTAVKQGGMNTKVRYITVTAMLSAVAFVLMYLEIAIPIMPSFIKFDFSDLPALLGSFALGPVCGVLICLIKNVLHLAFSNSMFVGELSNFILGAVFVAIAGNIYKHKKTKKSAVVSGLVAALVMGIVSVFSNYFVVYPVYYNFMPADTILAAYQAIFPGVKSILQSLIVFNMPFTFVKAMISVVITFLVYNHLVPILTMNKRSE